MNSEPTNLPGDSIPAAPSDPSALLAELGWDAARAAELAALAGPGQLPARVVARHRGRWMVAGAGGERSAVLAGRFLDHPEDELPTVGDWVVLEPGDDGGTARIARLLTRRSAFRRRAAGAATRGQTLAANVELALVVTALSGDLNPRRLERYLALAWESGALPLVVLSKAELCADLPAALAVAASAAPGVEVLPVSAATGEGVERIAARLLPGRTAVLLGSSGVGKSTLANRLLGEERLRTGGVRGDGRGRHTTTHRELLRLAGGALLIDTPGMRELGLWDAGEGLEAAFGELERLARGCRFRDCGHDAEPGCAVRAAARDGTLDPARLESWRSLRRELAAVERRRDGAAAAEERRRVRAAQRAVRAHLRRKRG
ncbi:MAG TPA: ribosome small subunit-dependent GTPase A [Longimicrobiaceae bacterium]|nr:ribosome small subunit-dependent GTPase A [Longimicrobiaceae bacterium]